MKKLICLVVAACMLLVLTAFSVSPEPGETKIKAWTREGAFEDTNGNHLIINFSDTEGYKGWAVSLMLDDEVLGWIIQQEGSVLCGNLNGWDNKVEPFNVIITEEGENGVKLETEDGDTYHFSSIEVQEAAVTVTVNIEGWGQIAYTEGEKTPEIDPEFPAQSAYIGLAEPEVYTFIAVPQKGNDFLKWTKNGEDYSTEPQITVLLDENAEYIAVFEEDPGWQNPVMNFVGEYQSDQLHAAIECFRYDEAWITIECGSRTEELTRWIIVGTLDTYTLTVEYEGAGKANLVFDEEGEVKSEERVYDDGTGKILFHDDGTFTWHEDQSESADDRVFEWVESA